MGRSRGGLTTRIHALVDADGFPIALKRRARYMTLETITTLSDDPAVSLPAIASGPARLKPAIVVTCRHLHHATGYDPEKRSVG
jgi:hypothetical protein